MVPKKKTKWMRSAFGRRTVLMLLGIILGINVYLANARGLTRNQLPMPFGTGVAVVLSGSMEPTLHVGDLIFVRQAEHYCVGDIVVYQTERELIVHRILSVDGDSFLTQGDANNTADPPIGADVIQGTVVRRIPAAGKIVNILRTPLGILGILALAFGLIEFSFRRDKKADEEQIESIKAEIRRLKAQQGNTSDGEK